MQQGAGILKSQPWLSSNASGKSHPAGSKYAGEARAAKEREAKNHGKGSNQALGFSRLPRNKPHVVSHIWDIMLLVYRLSVHEYQCLVEGMSP